jgi:hypothetical protein
MNLGELAPYVVRTDHDGVELELRGLRAWGWPPIGFGVFILSWGLGLLDGSWSWVGWLLAALLLDGLLFVRTSPASARLRLDRRGLVHQGRRVSTSDLGRIDTTDTSLELVYEDGRCERLDLALENPYLLEVLARLLEEHAARDGSSTQVPPALRRLRERNPQ